nr:MAG TPA: immunity protein [Caudoviricetes sp.]
MDYGTVGAIKNPSWITSPDKSAMGTSKTI